MSLMKEVAIVSPGDAVRAIVFRILKKQHLEKQIMP